VVIVEDAEVMKQLTGYVGSHTLIYCVDFNRLRDTARHLGDELNLRGTPDFVTAAIDASLVAQTAAVAARSLGVDALFTNGIHRGDIERIYRLLDLPRNGCFPLVALVLGYARNEPTHRRGRLDGAGIIHRGTYRPASAEELDEIISRFDDPESRLGVGVPWREKGFAHYLNWFFQVWSNRAPREPGRTQILRALERAGLVEASASEDTESSC